MTDVIYDGRSLAVALYGEDRGRGMTPPEFLATFGFAPPPVDALDVVMARAEVNAGTWIARCPNGCERGGCVIFLEQPQAWCAECQPQAWWPVLLPADTSAIESALLARPGEHRHWLPDETVDDLLRENDENLGDT